MTPETLSHQGHRFHQLLKTFTNCVYRYKYNSTFRDLTKKGISLSYYGDVI